MAHGFSNRVWCDTATTGTGNVAIGAPKAAHCTPDDAGTQDGEERTWLLEEVDDFEIFRGAYTASGAIATRGTVLLSQIGGVTGTTRMTLAGAATIRQVAAAEDLLSIVDRSAARMALGIPKKNYIVNGAMQVSQENGATVGTTNIYFAVDQFYHAYNYSATVQFSQQNIPTPGGSQYRTRSVVTVADASVAATDYYLLIHSIEGYRAADLLFGTASAKTFTVLFGVKAPAGTYALAVRNAASNRSYVAEFTISPGDANTEIRKAVIIPGDTSGAWDKTNGKGIQLLWTLTSGSNFQTTAGAWAAGNYLSSSNVGNFVGAVSNTFELFDVDMYEGIWTVESAPDYVVPDFEDTLRRCQRYWAKSYDYATPVGTAVTSQGMVAILTAGNAAGVALGCNVIFPVTMRAAPAVSIYGYSSGSAGYVYSAGTGAEVAGVSDSISRDRCRVYGVTTYGIYFHWKADARLI